MESTLPSLLFLNDKFSEKQIKNGITIPDSPSNPRKNYQSPLSEEPTTNLPSRSTWKDGSVVEGFLPKGVIQFVNFE